MCGSSRSSSAPSSRSRTADFARVSRGSRRYFLAEGPPSTVASSRIDQCSCLSTRGQNEDSARVTIFLGCGFAAKYREGGGNFSVPLQWMLGLRRLKLDAIWLELLPGTNDPRADQARIDNFQRRLRAHGVAGRYCLLYQNPALDTHDLSDMRCIGMSKRALLDRLAGPNTLLNLSYSIHPPFLLQF